MAVARKLAVLIWNLLTKEQDYFWARPALVAAKQRLLALKAGAPGERGVRRRGSACAYKVKELRNSEKAAAENAERAYELMVRYQARTHSINCLEFNCSWLSSSTKRVDGRGGGLGDLRASIVWDNAAMESFFSRSRQCAQFTGPEMPPGSMSRLV
ncbi:hypothetical protein NKH34_30490 [Mesorhizobium sp. M1148]